MAADLTSDVRRINLSFDPKDVENSCFRLVREVSSEWKSTEQRNVNFKAFTEGITNTLIKVTRQPPGRSDADADRDAVLVRAYGSGTDTMIDRAKELRVHKLLAEKDLASSVLAKFDNGFLCGYIPGQACEAEDFHDTDTARAMAKRLGEWHGSLPISVLASARGDQIPNIWTNADQWIDLLPADTAELKQRNDLFRSELKWLLELLANTPGLDGKDLVFSHTDLLCGNVLLEPDQAERSVTFIDYEYATAAPPAFDVANVFAEWAGPDGELSFMPSQSQRLDFIKHYVDSFRTHNGRSVGKTSSGDVVQQLYEQVDLFRGLPGFYWGIWGLIQASISDIDFDYVAYAARRHSEYWGWKAEYDGSRAQEGKEATVREKAWSKE